MRSQSRSQGWNRKEPHQISCRSQSHIKVLKFLIFTLQYKRRGKSWIRSLSHITLPFWSRIQVPIKMMRSRGQSHKEPHQNVKLLKFYVYTARKSSQRRSQNRIILPYRSRIILPSRSQIQRPIKMRGSTTLVTLHAYYQQVNFFYFCSYTARERSRRRSCSRIILPSQSRSRIQGPIKIMRLRNTGTGYSSDTQPKC
jgi:hypothetical protein